MLLFAGWTAPNDPAFGAARSGEGSPGQPRGAIRQNDDMQGVAAGPGCEVSCIPGKMWVTRL